MAGPEIKKGRCQEADEDMVAGAPHKGLSWPHEKGKKLSFFFISFFFFFFFKYPDAVTSAY